MLFLLLIAWVDSFLRWIRLGVFWCGYLDRFVVVACMVERRNSV